MHLHMIKVKCLHQSVTQSGYPFRRSHKSYLALMRSMFAGCNRSVSIQKATYKMRQPLTGDIGERQIKITFPFCESMSLDQAGDKTDAVNFQSHLWSCSAIGNISRESFGIGDIAYLGRGIEFLFDEIKNFSVIFDAAVRNSTWSGGSLVNLCNGTVCPSVTKDVCHVGRPCVEIGDIDIASADKNSFIFGSPEAVLGAVSAFAVPPSEEVSRAWAVAHVSEKVGESILPFPVVADDGFFVSIHLSPALIFRSRSTDCCAMRTVQSAENFPHEAPAASGPAILQAASWDGLGVPAIALTQPQPVTAWRRAGASCNDEAAESNSDKVLVSGDMPDRMAFGHRCALLPRVC